MVVASQLRISVPEAVQWFERLSRWVLVFLLAPPILEGCPLLALPQQPLVVELLKLRQAELGHHLSAEAPIGIPGDHIVIMPDHRNAILGHLQSEAAALVLARAGSSRALPHWVS